MAIELPFSRPLLLSDARLAALKRPVVLTRAGVAAFVAHFTATGFARRAWDLCVATICLRTSEQALLAAIAYNKIATVPGGQAFLSSDRRLRQMLDMSAELLLSELTPAARLALLCAPPQLYRGGLPVVRLGEAGGTRVELVLTRDCFGRARYVGSWQLTRRDIGRSGWRQKNEAREYTFLRALVELTKTSRLDRANHATLRHIMHCLMDAGPQRWPDQSGHLREPADTVNAALCKQLAAPLRGAATPAVAQARGASACA